MHLCLKGVIHLQDESMKECDQILEMLLRLQPCPETAHTDFWVSSLVEAHEVDQPVRGSLQSGDHLNQSHLVGR